MSISVDPNYVTGGFPASIKLGLLQYVIQSVSGSITSISDGDSQSQRGGEARSETDDNGLECRTDGLEFDNSEFECCTNG